MFVSDNVFTCCSRTSSCFGACYRSSSPENLAISSWRFVLQPFLFGHVVWSILLLTKSESQADMMVGTFQHLHFVPSLHRLCAVSPWAAFLVILVQDHPQKWSYHGSQPFPMISKNHPLRCLQQGTPHHPYSSGYVTHPDSFKWSIVICLRLV